MPRNDDQDRLRHMLDIVWNIVTDDLPTLISKLEKLVPPETG